MLKLFVQRSQRWFDPLARIAALSRFLAVAKCPQRTSRPARQDTAEEQQKQRKGASGVQCSRIFGPMFVQDDRMRPLDEVAKRQLESLRRQHHALYPAYLLRLPPNEILASEEGQRFLVERILSDPLIRYVPPERGYRRGFWRRAVAELEKGVEELRDNGEDVSHTYSMYNAACFASGLLPISHA